MKLLLLYIVIFINCITIILSNWWYSCVYSNNLCISFFGADWELYGQPASCQSRLWVISLSMKLYLWNVSTQDTWVLRNLRLMPESLFTGLTCTVTFKTQWSSVLCATGILTLTTKSLFPAPNSTTPLGVDYFTLDGKDFLLMLDYYSKYLEVVKMTSKIAQATIAKLKIVLLDRAMSGNCWQHAI